MAETVQYGWYSLKAVAQTGTIIYRTPEGTEVEVNYTSGTNGAATSDQGGSHIGCLA